ncbi:MAG: NADH-quinone oxidoreductase subunit NuoE [Planctomycetota bacterium]
MKTFAKDLSDRLDAIVKSYPVKRAALMNVLHEVQAVEGWLSDETLLCVADYMGLAPADVLGVVSFYSMYYRRPVGRHVINVCRTLSCALRGAEQLLEHLRSQLQIDVGETTEDGRCTLGVMECLGSCGTAPVIEVHGEYRENCTTRDIDELLTKLK